MPDINQGIMPLPKAKGKRARKGTLSHTKGKRHASAHQRLMGGLADELFSFCLGHGCTFWRVVVVVLARLDHPVAPEQGPVFEVHRSQYYFPRLKIVA